MIWRWLICFSLLINGAAAAVVKGRVATERADGRSSRPPDLSGTVIWLESLNEQAGTDPPRTTPRTNLQHFTILQKNKTFQPHILAIPMGSVVDFPNSDPIFHNAFSNYNGQIFDIGLYPPGSSRSVTFRRPGIVRVFCNIHSTMSAVIVVTDTPYEAISSAAGSFEIDNVPPGLYRLSVYHERATEQELASLTRTVTVGSAGADVGVLALTESGYLEVPHLNKYGRKYPSPAADAGAYPGARQ